MIGIIIAVIISWALLRLVSKKDLSVLGFAPTKNRIIALAIGMALAIVTCTIYHLMTTATVDNSWILNKAFTSTAALEGCWWTFKSVLTEELIFRGALLYIMIEKMGAKTACVISAVCFGVYHWFSFGALGNPVQMSIVLLVTGFFGYALAIAFAKTKSLYLPVGVHFGWNLANIIVFSNGPLGAQILLKVNINKPEGILSLMIFLFQALTIPILTLLYAKKIQNSIPNTYTNYDSL